MTLHLTAVAAKDGASVSIPGGIDQNDTSGTGAGPNIPVNILVDSTSAEILGTTADAAVTAGASGSIGAKLRSISRDIVSNIVLAAGSNIIGAVTQSGSWVLSAGSALIGKVQISDGTTALPVLAGSSGAPATSAPALAVSLRDVNPNGQATMANSAPVVLASNQSAIPVTTAVTATANGGTFSRVNAAGSTNATNLKASGGQVYAVDVFNVAAYNVFLKLYNKASSPTVGTDTPFMTIPVQSGGGVSLHFNMGLPMATGISYAITKLQADSDTTAVTAGDLTGGVLWI